MKIDCLVVCERDSGLCVHIPLELPRYARRCLIRDYTASLLNMPTSVMSDLECVGYVLGHCYIYYATVSDIDCALDQGSMHCMWNDDWNAKDEVRDAFLCRQDRSGVNWTKKGNMYIFNRGGKMYKYLLEGWKQ